MNSLHSCLYGIIPSQTMADIPGSQPESTIQTVFLHSFLRSLGKLRRRTRHVQGVAQGTKASAHKPQRVEKRRNSNDDGQRRKGRHEDRSLRDPLPRLGTRRSDVGVLRGRQRRHNGH